MEYVASQRQRSAAVALAWTLWLALWIRRSTLNITQGLLEVEHVQARPERAVAVAIGGQVPQPACRNGYLTAPRRDTIWKYMKNESIPMLTDVAVAEGRVYAIFNLKRTPGKSWALSDWWFTFQEAGGERVLAGTFGVDPKGNTFTAFVPLPAELSARPSSDSLHVTISAPALGIEYEGVPFCLYPPDTPTYGLVHCTQNVPDAKASALFPEWIAYHAAMGFEHAFVYANGQPAPLEAALTPLAARGLVTVVDWQWPQRYDRHFVFQQAQENSCLVRARGRARWVGLHDLDEFFQPLGDASVAAFLDRRCPANTPCDLSALRVKSWYFDAHANATLQARFAAAAASSRSPTLSTWHTRADSAVDKGREKGLVQPANVHYWSVHMVSKGRPMMTINVTRDMRLAHFRHHRGQQFTAIDNSFQKASLQVDAMLAGVMGPGWRPLYR